MLILVNVAGNDEIDWHPEKGTIRKSDDEYAPDTEYLNEPQDPR